MSRKIIHIDMDAFFAAVEQRDFPELRGKCLVIGPDPRIYPRGVVCTASYEARKYGVRSAMPCSKALKLCPHAIFKTPDGNRYKEASRQIREIFYQVTDLVEPLSLDEAYLDVTNNKFNGPSATKLARWIKAQVKEKLNLTASAGVGPNKLIAKIASDYNKPDGLTVVTPHQVDQFLEPLPLRKIWGIGPVTAKRMEEKGLKYVRDVLRLSENRIENYFGTHGLYIYELCQGIDEREVCPFHDPKSRGSEVTFPRDILDTKELDAVLQGLCEDVTEGLTKISKLGRTINLKVRYSDFTTITRSKSVEMYNRDFFTIYNIAKELLDNHTQAGNIPVRLLGLSVSNLQNENDPIQLFFDWL